MSRNDYSAKLPEMEGIQIENLEETEKEIVLQISLERSTQKCKRCGAETDRIHDYRIRQVRDLELRGKPLRLLYRRRRYACPVCGKRFAEKNAFVGRYMRFTHRKGNAGGELFQCIITDPQNRSVFDILPSRTVGTIQNYLRSFSNRKEVKYVIMDMNRG